MTSDGHMKRSVATLLFLGHCPFAPGTAASAVTVGIAAAYYQRWEAPWPLLTLAAALFFAGLWSVPAVSASLGREDPQQVVIDEAVGQLLVCAAVAPTVLPQWNLWAELGIAFVLFRALDIAKPPPVGQAERLKGALGVMADDVIAGVIAGGLLLGLKAVLV